MCEQSKAKKKKHHCVGNKSSHCWNASDLWRADARLGRVVGHVEVAAVGVGERKKISVADETEEVPLGS